MPPLAQPKPYARPLRETTTLCMLNERNNAVWKGEKSAGGRAAENVFGGNAQSARHGCDFFPLKHVDIFWNCGAGSVRRAYEVTEILE